LADLILVLMACFVAGGLSGLLVGQWNKRLGTRLALACAIAGGLLSTAIAVAFWIAPMQEPRVLASLLKFPDEFSSPTMELDFFVDRLSAFFLLLTGALSAGVALYSFVWLEDKRERERIAGIYNLFVLSTVLLLVVNNVYLFLFFLECLSLAFSYLTLYRHNALLSEDVLDPHDMDDAKRAFKVYLVFSHVGAIFITAALILLAVAAGSLSFDAIRAARSPDLDYSNAIFLLALIGFGIKGGFAPAHTWVSIVHPKSPTTTHALTLGLIIKVSSFYMLMRVLFEFLASPPWWWGLLVILLAGFTALTGVFYAIVSRDLKTALSNHSVENIGIILAGIGLALLSADHAPTLAGLALIASLYHLLNHTVFKGLLYLGTGAIEHRTGTVKLEQLGGLLNRMPWTSATFLVGTVAIAGLPPFNGFISEWLTLQALFAGLDFYAVSSTSPFLLVGILIVVLMLVTAFGLTALAFVKIAGETLLGMPRRPSLAHQNRPGDVPWKMRGVLLFLACLCLLLGLLPGTVVNQLAYIPHHLLNGQPEQAQASLNFGMGAVALVLNLPTSDTQFYTAHLSMLPFVLLAGLPLALALLVGTSRKPHVLGSPWTCATSHSPEAMQITGGAFAFLTWAWAGGQAGPAAGGRSPMPWRLMVTQTRYVREFFRRAIDGTLERLLSVSQYVGDWFQAGDIRQYLAYLFVAFVIALILFVMRTG
jgi:hydrogenase-4 component B